MSKLFSKLFKDTKNKLAWLVFGSVVLVASLSFGNTPSDCFVYDGKEICTVYADDNKDENLIIKTDSQNYGSFDKFDVYFSLENKSGKDQNVDISFLFENGKNANIVSVKELIQNETYQVEEDILTQVVSKDKCEKVLGETACYTTEKIGTQIVTKTRDRWNTVQINTLSVITKDFTDFTSKTLTYSTDRKSVYFIPQDTKRFFKVEVDIPNRLISGQFVIEAKGDNAYGSLDPWFSASYQYCRKLTMTAGGTSGGVATTTTAGFALVATSTISSLSATSSGGRIYELASYTLASTTPVDFVVTNGTDCLTAGGTLLDFYFEEYDKTTGKFVLWLESNDISSTTPKTVLTYYGYADASATDQQNETGVWGANGELAVWNMHEDPSGVTPQLLDSTSNNYDLGTGGAMLTANLIDSYVDGGIDFDGANDFASTTQFFTTAITNWSFGTWIRRDAQSATWDFILDTWKTAGAYGRMAFNTSNQLICASRDSGGVTVTNTYTTLLSTGIYYYVSCSRNSVTDLQLLYVNGVMVVSQADTRTGNFGGTAGTEMIGTQGDNAAGWFNGVIDDLRVYNRGLHAMDILTIYNNTVSSTIFWTFGEEETATTPASTPDDTYFELI